MGAQSDLPRFTKKEVENNRKYEEMPAVSMSAFPEGWTFGVIKSLQQVDLYIFAKIITDMVKKMLFLWVRECGQEWSERPHATVQMQGLRTPF